MLLVLRDWKMPAAATRLEILQVRKLIQCVREKDIAQITKMAQIGIDGLMNLQGECRWIDYATHSCKGVVDLTISELEIRKNGHPMYMM